MPSPAKPVVDFSLLLLSDLRQQSEYLIRRQRQHPKHQVRHHLRISLARICLPPKSSFSRPFVRSAWLRSL